MTNTTTSTPANAKPILISEEAYEQLQWIDAALTNNQNFYFGFAQDFTDYCESEGVEPDYSAALDFAIDCANSDDGISSVVVDAFPWYPDEFHTYDVDTCCLAVVLMDILGFELPYWVD